jgi:integrase
LRPRTRQLYEKYSVYWLAHLALLEEHAIALYFRRRLKEVRGKSARSELSALRGLLSWLVETRELEQVPALPKITSAQLGTPYKDRRRVAAPEYTRAEIRRVIAKLPDKSPSGFWVRPRCEFLYLTSLRPTTVDALSVPEHWSRGSRSLNVTDEVDKEGFARDLPLPRKALAILMRCAPAKGPIFGEHRYDPFVHEAASKALPAAKARVFTSQHLRSARGTHLLDAGASLPGVQFLMGHKSVATTARYIRPSKRAAQAALRKVRGE